MRYGRATNTTTFKCEGCGKRLTAGMLYWASQSVKVSIETAQLLPGLITQEVLTVCSPACTITGGLKRRQTIDRFLSANAVPH